MSGNAEAGAAVDQEDWTFAARLTKRMHQDADGVRPFVGAIPGASLSQGRFSSEGASLEFVTPEEAMSLDPSKIPIALRLLIPYAQRWGVSDDYERDTVIQQATSDERQESIQRADAFESELFAWLAGPESATSPSSSEYIAFTNLTLAIDYARALKD